MKQPQPRGRRPARRRYELAIVLAFAALFAGLWALSLPGVRARMATRAWESGDVEEARRLAALATRRQPELAGMWMLQARCEERLGTPCDAALSYSRAALAATEQLGRLAADRLAAAPAGGRTAAEEPADPSTGELRETAIRRALAIAAECNEVSTFATVFEALTVGLPSSPDRRGGIWPGEPGISSGRPSAEALAAALPPEPELQMPWIEFLWRRQELEAAALAARRLEQLPDDLPAPGLWLVGRILLASGRDAGAAEAFRRALVADPGWVPAAAGLAELEVDGPGLEPRESGSEPPSWRRLPVGLEAARVDAEIFDVGDGVLLLATEGSVTFELEAPAPGTRAFFGVAVRGTPARGSFPQLDVRVDGMRVASVEATGAALPVVVELPPRSREPVSVSFAFGNDWADETGDRNVFFSSPELYWTQ